MAYDPNLGKTSEDILKVIYSHVWITENEFDISVFDLGHYQVIDCVN